MITKLLVVCSLSIVQFPSSLDTVTLCYYIEFQRLFACVASFVHCRLFSMVMLTIMHTYVYQSAWLRFVVSIRQRFHRCRFSLFSSSDNLVFFCFFYSSTYSSGYEMCSEIRHIYYIQYTHMVHIGCSSFPHMPMHRPICFRVIYVFFLQLLPSVGFLHIHFYRIDPSEEEYFKLN